MKTELKIVKAQSSEMTERQKKALAEIEARHAAEREAIIKRAADVNYTVDRGGRDPALEINDIVRKATRDADDQPENTNR